MPFTLLRSVSIVVKISLNENDGGTLVARAGCKIAKRAYKVGKLTGSCSLSRHVTNKRASVLLLDALGNCLLKSLTRKILEVVVCKILELKLVGCTNKTVGICRRYYRVCKLPYLTLGILEGTVAVNHDLNVLAGFFKNILLDVKNNVLTVAGEELDLILGALVRAEKTVLFVAAA